MGEAKRFFSVVFIGMSAFLTVALMGCNPSGGNSSTPEARISTVSEEAAKCEAQLRKQMEEKSLQLKNFDGIDPEKISAANKIISGSFQKINYSLRLVQKEIVEVQLQHYKRTEDTETSVQYEISKASKYSGALLSLNTKVTDLQANGPQTIRQSYQVQSDCSLKATQTSLEKMSRLDSTRYNYSELAAYADKSKKNESKNFEVPNGGYLIGMTPGQNELPLLPKKGYALFGTAGVVEFEISEKEPTTIREFNIDLTLTNHELKVVSNGQTLLSATYGEDKNAGFALTEILRQQTWKVPKTIWKKSPLGSSGDLNSFIRSELPKVYLKNSGTFQLIASKTPQYDHFSAYFKSTENSVDKETGRVTLTLTENPHPVIQGPVVAADLQSNSTIQTELPEIQTIAQGISSRTSNRLERIQLILDYLGANYVYDYEMLKNNIVRPLSTQEALSRGTGVCQHYAVIYTAIARALKIPTRIVYGYLLMGDAPGAHAWVESEIQPGLWRVIEPQSPSTLKQMNTRFYLPFSRATSLEDKDQGMGKELLEIYSIDYVLMPVN